MLMEFTWRKTNTMTNLQGLRDQLKELEETWQLPFKTMFALQLTIEEMVTNAVMHCKKNATLDLIVKKLENKLVIIIKDDAAPFNPLELKEPDIDAPAEKRCVGGLGIHLVKKKSKKFEYRRENDHNIVTLTIDNSPQ